MKFTGYGQIWSPSKGKCIVDFNETAIFETENAADIKALKDSGQVTPYSEQVEWPEEKYDDQTEITNAGYGESLGADDDSSENESEFPGNESLYGGDSVDEAGKKAEQESFLKLESMSKKDLVLLAGERDVDFEPSMTKAEIVQLLKR